MARSLLAIALVCVCSGCNGSGNAPSASDEPGLRDAATPLDDAGARDGGPRDAGPVDAGSGTADAGQLSDTARRLEPTWVRALPYAPGSLLARPGGGVFATGPYGDVGAKQKGLRFRVFSDSGEEILSFDRGLGCGVFSKLEGVSGEDLVVSLYSFCSDAIPDLGPSSLIHGAIQRWTATGQFLNTVAEPQGLNWAGSAAVSAKGGVFCVRDAVSVQRRTPEGDTTWTAHVTSDTVTQGPDDGVLVRHHSPFDYDQLSALRSDGSVAWSAKLLGMGDVVVLPDDRVVADVRDYGEGRQDGSLALVVYSSLGAPLASVPTGLDAINALLATGDGRIVLLYYEPRGGRSCPRLRVYGDDLRLIADGPVDPGCNVSFGGIATGEREIYFSGVLLGDADLGGGFIARPSPGSSSPGFVAAYPVP